MATSGEPEISIDWAQSKSISSTSQSHANGDLQATASDTHMSHKLSIARSPSLHFRLTDLPPELRNRIYEYALVLNDPIHLHNSIRAEVKGGPRHLIVEATVLTKHSKDGTQPHPRLRTDALATGLLRASKAIYTETAGIFYGHNKFVFDYPYAFNDFMDMIGTVQAAMLSDVKITHFTCCTGPRPLFPTLAPSASNLTRLEIELHAVNNRTPPEIKKVIVEALSRLFGVTPGQGHEDRCSYLFRGCSCGAAAELKKRLEPVWITLAKEVALYCDRTAARVDVPGADVMELTEADQEELKRLAVGAWGYKE